MARGPPDELARAGGESVCALSRSPKDEYLPPFETLVTLQNGHWVMSTAHSLPEEAGDAAFCCDDFLL